MKYTTSIFAVLFLGISCSHSAPPQPTSPKQAAPDLHTAIPMADVDPKPTPTNVMVEIDGMYCPSVQQRCLYMVDANGKRTNEDINPNGRCGEWENPVKCNSKLVHKHFYIDQYELPNQAGAIPKDWLTWYDAKNVCESEGKRLCTRSEWTFAAEGPHMHPYPYGDGFHRDKTLCNFDNPNKGIDVFKATSPSTPEAIALHSMLLPSGSQTKCVSDWGVYDMPGNIDEWVVNESGKPFHSGLMGGHVFGVRNASRPMTDAHGPDFSWYETGGRCCKDAK